MVKKIFIAFAIVLLFGNPLKGQIVIEMERQGDLFAIPCKVNGLPIKLLFDTGASGVSISLTEALFMYKNGYLSDDDIGGTVYSQIANGDIVENTEITIREIEIGGLKITNIKAMVSSTLSAPLLLGQSVIQKLGPIQLDGNKLIILTGKDANTYQNALSYYGRSYEQNEAGQYRDAIVSAQKGLALTNDMLLRMSLYDEIAAAYKGLGMLDSAIISRRMALASYPNKTTAYNLGNDLYEQKQFDAAYRAFEQCVHLEQSGAADANSVLTAAYAYLADIDYMNGRMYDAERYAKKSMEYNPSSMASFTLGHVYQDKKDYSMATQYYEQGIRFEPNRPSNAKYYGTLGYLYSIQGSPIFDLQKAVEKYEKSIEVYEDFHRQIVQAGFESENIDDEHRQWAYFSATSSARILFFAGLHSIAADNMRKAASFNNGVLDRADDYLIWANCVSDSIEMSRITFEGLKQFPDDPDLLFQQAYSIEQDCNTAIKIYNRILSIIQLKPLKLYDLASVYNNIAWNYHLLGQSSTGLPYSKKSVELNPNHDYSWNTLGEIYFVLKRYQDCIDASNRCIALSDKYKKESYDLIGKSKIALGKKREGEKYLERARSILE